MSHFWEAARFFFALYRAGKIQNARLSDLNAELIDTYTAVRDSAETILDRLATFPHTENFFYKMRAKNPKRMILPNRAARMIYLNKTCYNGLYRVNLKGQFNAPFGRYKNPTYRDPDNIHAVAKALRTVTLEYAGFESVLNHATAGDLVYFDPPYVPLSATANFTSYHADGFTHIDQVRLRDTAQELTKMGVRVILSNSAAPIVRELYETTGFTIHEVSARRAINSDPTKRGKLSEFVITNKP